MSKNGEYTAHPCVPLVHSELRTTVIFESGLHILPHGGICPFEGVKALAMKVRIKKTSYYLSICSPISINRSLKEKRECLI